MTDHVLPTLYKLCNKEFNLAMDGTGIRLGKLSYYRSFEDNEIGDRQEGVKKHMGYINEQPEKIPIYHYSINDSFVFSTSVAIDGKIADYPSCYKITDAKLFSHQIADCIFDQLTIGEIQLTRAVDKGITLGTVNNLDIRMQRRLVKYHDSPNIAPVHYEFNQIKIDEDLFNMHLVAFWRDLSYQDQQEFRLTFDIIAQQANGTEVYCAPPMPYLDVDLFKYKDQLPVELVY